MSRMLQCRRIVSYIKNNRNSRYYVSNVSANPKQEPIIDPKETIISSSSQLSDQPPPPAATADAVEKKSLWRFLKNGILTALIGTSATAGFATYSYTREQVDEMTKSFRESANYPTVDEDASSLKKFEASLYSTAMSVPAKCIEIYLDLRRSIEEQVEEFKDPISDKLLPDLQPHEQNVLTLVLDLNETLIYTDWKRERGWRTFKRPGVDVFLERLGQLYEIVIYSDQLDIYVNPIVDRLDPNHNRIRHRLSRPATKYQDGKHYRDLSKLNRDCSRVLYIGAHALESALQPENCAPIKPWKLEEGDTTLIDLIPFLEFVAIQNYSRPNPPDIRQVLASYKGCDIASEFHKRQREAQDKQKPGRRIWSR